mgnify:FL=1
MAWFRESEYQRVRKEMADGHLLHRTFREWHKAAQQGEASLTQQGRRVIRAQIKLDDFLAWCASLNISPNADARMRWANEVAYRELMQERSQ